MPKESGNTRRKVIVDNAANGGLSRWVRLVFSSMLVVGLLSLIGTTFLVYNIKKDLPVFESVSQYKPLLGSMLYASDGTKIAEFATEKRLIVPYEQIPRQLILAFIATEDKYFFDHFGMDPKGTLRAALRFVSAGFEKKEGASTITMQLARTFFLSRDKTWIRKIKEIILAVFEFERNLSKEEILWLYLNQIYLGHGAYGVQQASLTYFGKDVWDLELEEMAVLAGLPQRPGKDSPYINPEAALARRNHVLKRMFKEGFIDRESYDTVLERPIVLAEETDLFLAYAPHFSEHVRKYIYNKYGEQQLYSGGLHIKTTLNLDAQKYAQDALYYGLRNLDHRQGYRRAPANIPEKLREAFTERMEDYYADSELERARIFWGLVTRVDDKREKAWVRVGRWEAPILLSSIKWARKPNPDVLWSHALVRKPSHVFKVGDVVMVRPTEPENIMRTFDFRSEKAVDEDKLIWCLEQEPIAQSALLAKDPESGYTIAMVGGYNFESSEFNRAIQACRQPGSAFKPIVYTAAIDSGWTVSSILLDAPIVSGEWKWKWTPNNYGADFKGEVSVRYSLQHSLNIPAIKTIDEIGVVKVKEYAQRMGIRSNIQEDRSISLGTACVTPEDLVNVFAHYPLLGRKPRTIYVKTVIDRYGNILEDNRAYYDITLDPAEKLAKMEEEALVETEYVFPQTTAYIMNWMLQEVIRGGTGSAAKALGRPCGGKTGTTNDNYDAWFVGFTPHIVASVWIGHDDNSRPLGKLETGGKSALPIWLDFMKRTLENAPVSDFKVPAGIQWILTDQKTGRQCEAGMPNLVKAPFKYGSMPKEKMSFEGGGMPDELFNMTEIY